MCGRINVSDNEGVRILLAMLGMDTWPSRDPLYNVAPTDTLDVLVNNDTLTCEPMRWGLIPSWTKPGKYSAPLINARSETINEKRSFRQLIIAHRCVLPVTGFYEWRREAKQKTPFYVHAANERGLLLAAIYQPLKSNAAGENNEVNDGAQVCVVTTEANQTMQAVHTRMPVLLTPEEAAIWLSDCPADSINALMKPASNDALELTEVSSTVNSVKNKGPDCMQAVSA